jgi:hypothetical protein
VTLTDSILAQIRAIGNIVKVFTVNGVVEMHAIQLTGENEPQIARCNDGNGPDEEYRAACLLAAACEVELEDG